MSEFSVVINQWNRMLEAHNKGETIPLKANYVTMIEKPEEFDNIVMEWAADHPEPVYPTWEEWLEYYMCKTEAIIDTPLSLIEWMHRTRISADIAEMLDIDPYET